MQLHLPIFPADCTMISDTVGCYKKDGLIQYIVNGLPVYAHAESDLASFRFITSNFISQKLCRKSEIKANFHVSEDGIDRYLKKFLAEGGDAFFGNGTKRKSNAHKLHGDKLEKAQQGLDKGESMNSIAKKLKVTEGSIRYQVRTGALKKTVGQNKQ